MARLYAAELLKGQNIANSGVPTLYKVGNRHWVFEFKFTRTLAEVKKLLTEAINQIQSTHDGEERFDGRPIGARTNNCCTYPR